MVDHIADRDRILDSLKEELVGPAPAGEELDCTQHVRFDDMGQSYRCYRQKGSGEEILQRDPPTKRYGIGVLYPLGTMAGDTVSDLGQAAAGLTSLENSSSMGEAETPSSIYTDKAQRELGAQIENAPDDANADELDISGANTYRPSSMGVSFLARISADSELVVEAQGGRYHPLVIETEKGERMWWLRNPVTITASFAGPAMCTPHSAKVTAGQQTTVNSDGLDLRIEVFSRPYAEPECRLVTVCLVNRTPAGRWIDESALFQSRFRLRVVRSAGDFNILPYPDRRTSGSGDTGANALDREEASLKLLYRHEETYAVGHGCAADWNRVVQDERASWISAECLPSFEVPSTTPEIRREDGTPLQVSMAALAGLVPGDDGYQALSEVIALYSEWIDKKRKEVVVLPQQYRDAAALHLDQCTRCLKRMQTGLQYLLTNETAKRAFQLANHAILLQQLHSRRESRQISFDDKANRLRFSEAYAEPDPRQPTADRGMWRPFQIAFLLMSIHSTAELDAPERRTVELIWFPTGGGKTEAYLGLAAFALFMRRLSNPSDTGVHILMRYTLRLLTAQQFQRASGLACAMEYLRRRNAADLGSAPLSIGIWVGGENTPNKRADAISALNALQADRFKAKNPFVLGRCPWCGSQMGPFETKTKLPKGFSRVVGYVRQGDTVVFRCPDNQCEFSNQIPVYVIDEDIYAERPSLVIGTVDKFAMLAWRPEARALFGIDEDGRRQHSPPGLIIQDELHLISGPLGSMVGLYEPVIEELCTDRRNRQPVPPKIVSSTATIRRYVDQIKSLYGRDDVALFPPPGLEAGDSFFARYARNSDGTLQHGRMYVGVHAPGLGSMQTTQVRTFTTLLQAPMQFPSPQARDPWWTLLLFFNSLRELGTTLSLFQSDIPDYFKVLMNRMGAGFDALRYLQAPLELTGRIPSDEVPQAIAKLEVSCTGADNLTPQDVCLASNILEVGIDIDRLSLMAVVGQPKTTSQYIQVTGRIGRRWWERPGLVVTLYGAAKPRDRSHFEKFRSYHERLYAQVEPTSVTPFSPPALDRALHAIIACYARQAGSRQLARSPYPYPESLIAFLKSILLPRVQAIDPGEADHFASVFEKRAKEWERWQRTKWDSFSPEADTPLLRPAGDYAPAERARISWPTPQSMRTVDAECEAQITTLYITEAE